MAASRRAVSRPIPSFAVDVTYPVDATYPYDTLCLPSLVVVLPTRDLHAWDSRHGNKHKLFISDLRLRLLLGLQPYDYSGIEDQSSA